MVMVNLSDGVTRPSDLARAIGVSRQAIQRTLMEMEHEGLIHIVPDPEDGRAKIVEPSKGGKGIYTSALRAIAMMETELERRFGKNTINDLRRLLYADWGPVVIEARSKRAPRTSTARSPGSRWRKSNL